MSVFKQATIECIPSSSNCNKKFVPIPGWNEYVKEHLKFARDAFKWWNLNNRPRDGYIYHEMRSSRTMFKYALCFTRSIEDTDRADSLAKDLADGTIDDFWSNVRKVNSGNAIQANTIDGCSGGADIELCIYTLKEFIDCYKQRSTTVFVTFLDASKAFDKINYWLLFQKLFPTFFIKILAFWYTHQKMHV